MEKKGTKTDDERKSLVWEIRKGLFTLSAEELFQIAKTIGPVPERDSSELRDSDLEGCFDYVSCFMYSKSLLDSEDMGMSSLLMLRDVVNEILETRGAAAQLVHTQAGTDSHDTHMLASPANPGLGDTTHLSDTMTPPCLPNVATHNMDDSSHPDLQRMLASYEQLGRELQQYTTMSTPPSTLSGSVHTVTPSGKTPHTSQSEKPTHTSDTLVSLRDLSYLHRREFKVQGGQIGDHSSDITYNNIHKQIEEGIRENFSEAEIVRSVLRIVKPGHFKDLLMNKEDMTINELKIFLQSHLGEKSSTELLQDLMCAKQSESETPQQFLYRVMGLKQKVLFASKQANADIKYSPETVQGVFLHTIYQGLGHKYNDVRRELKPLLSDSMATDEAILRQVTKITSDETERQRRLGMMHRAKPTVAHSAQLEMDSPKTYNLSHDTLESKSKKDPLKQLSDKIDALTSVVDSMRQAGLGKPIHTCKCQMNNPPLAKRERTYGCTKCVEGGLPRCSHCFICGEGGHRAIGCLKKMEHPGNQGRSLARDHQ
ncbi:uncharacterized protein LOC125780868 [Astyanax mexicanus]|uniref:uncharacterized protein LOC125780868 n=1 Tax=Astyanax mexicanus TaxID=7994 RepID=UPI0020CB632F|nr:uncharacterized protein LOC125780868 [Astyanax mexicanus]